PLLPCCRDRGRAGRGPRTARRRGHHRHGAGWCTGRPCPCPPCRRARGKACGTRGHRGPCSGCVHRPARPGRCWRSCPAARRGSCCRGCGCGSYRGARSLPLSSAATGLRPASSRDRRGDCWCRSPAWKAESRSPCSRPTPRSR
ncbi:unnamed protein product, partial [Ectocarpus fasciculatus]